MCRIGRPILVAAVCLALRVSAQSLLPVIIFASPDCLDCERIKERWRETPEDHADLCLVVLDATHPSNYSLLERLETELAVTDGGDLPAVFAGGRIVYGPVAIDQEWYGLILDARETERQLLPKAVAPVLSVLDKESPMAGDVLSLVIPEQPNTGTGANAGGREGKPPVHLAVMNLEGCRKCSRLDVILRSLEAEYPNFNVRRFDAATPLGQGVMVLASRYYGVQANSFGSPPILFWQGDWQEGKGLSRGDIVGKMEPAEGVPFWQTVAEDQLRQLGLAASKRRLEGFSLGVVVAGGLLDGINPCAFAAVIFLVSYLACVGRDRRGVAMVGASFCGGVFLTYMLIGLGLSFVLGFVHRLTWLQVGLYSALGAGGLILAAVHVRDIARFRRSGKVKDMEGGLSPQTTRKIHGWVRRLAASPYLIPAGAALGCVISILELACTGQIYLPVLSIINREGITTASLSLLFVYCLAFVLPLVAVTALAAVGVQTQAISNWARRNLVTTKLAMAILFILLGGTMLFLAFRAAGIGAPPV